MCEHIERGGWPHVLLLATQPWPVSARLGLAMQAVGFRVSIWCPRSNALLLAGAEHKHYPYRMLDPVGSLEAAILAANPDLIVPCDEPATANLQQLAEKAMTTPRLDCVLQAIERSLGPAAGVKRLTERAYVLKVAADGGAAVPVNAAIANPADLRDWLTANGFPAYLKADGTFGGLGVRQIHSYEEAESAFHALHTTTDAVRAFKRAAFDHDPTLITPLLHRHQPAVSVQRTIAGIDVNSAIFCWQGRVLASLTMQVVTVAYEFGPSTVLRRIQNTVMDRTAEILASRLKLSGFYGLDFILDEQTGIPWLLEMNSRATQIPHLALGAGHDLPAAAFAALTGLPIRPRPAVTNEETIVLFPQEWNRDPASPLIRSSYYHDVPWESPALVRAYVHQRFEKRQLLTRRYWRHRKEQKSRREASAEAAAQLFKVKL
jgi:hypothetical protein